MDNMPQTVPYTQSKSFNVFLIQSIGAASYCQLQPCVQDGLQHAFELRQRHILCCSAVQFQNAFLIVGQLKNIATRVRLQPAARPLTQPLAFSPRGVADA